MDDLIERFEQTRLTLDEWHHQQHLLVALHYLRSCPAQAEERLRDGIQRLNAAMGVEQTPTGGYHETLTLAWARVLARLLESGLDTQAILQECSDTRLLLRHYSKERLMSWEARIGWMEPDRAPF